MNVHDTRFQTRRGCFGCVLLIANRCLVQFIQCDVKQIIHACAPSVDVGGAAALLAEGWPCSPLA